MTAPACPDALLIRSPSRSPSPHAAPLPSQPPEPGIVSFAPLSPSDVFAQAQAQSAAQLTRSPAFAPLRALTPPSVAPRRIDPASFAQAQQLVDCCVKRCTQLRDQGQTLSVIAHIDATLRQYSFLPEHEVTLLVHKARNLQQMEDFAAAVGLYTVADDACRRHSLPARADVVFQLAMANHLWLHSHSTGAPTPAQVDDAFARASGVLNEELLQPSLSEPRRATILHNQAFICEQRHCWADAKETYQEALRIRQALGDVRGQAYTYHRMAIVADRLGERSLATEASAAAVKLYAEAKITGQPRVEQARALAEALRAKGP